MQIEQNMGVAAEAAGLSPSGPSQQAVSSADAVSIPNAGHTPGPWFVDTVLYQRDFRAFVNVGQEHGFVAAVSSEPQHTATSVANARLIAAAPELLDVLRTARDYVADAASGGLTYEGSGEGFVAMAKENLARIDAAIAKAEGRP